MDTNELEKWARQWANGQRARWAYPKDSKEEKERQASVDEARKQIRSLGYEITTDDWSNVVIKMAFKV